jgi:hypothetical protein
MALVDACIEDVSSIDEGAAYETWPNSALDSAADGVAETNDAYWSPGKAAGELADTAANGEMGCLYVPALCEAPLIDAATEHLPLMVNSRVLTRIKSLSACGTMDAIPARRVPNRVILPHFGSPPRDPPLSLGRPVLMACLQVFGVRVGRSDTGKSD